MKSASFPAIIAVIGFTACHNPQTPPTVDEADTAKTITKTPIEHEGTLLHYPDEKYLNNIKQLTFGADNAEGYFSFDGKKIVFQSNNPDWTQGCDQIFYLDWGTSDLRADGSQPPLLSTGKGRTTCAYFLPGDTTILYASTHEGGDACPPEPERRADGAYVWPIYNTFNTYVADLQGNLKKTLIKSEGYDAEATVSPKGDKIVFTSTRNGDLDLYVCDIDGKNVKQITHELGYDGGAFFSPDGKKLVFRASRPKTEEEKAEYKALLAEGLVKPIHMEIYVCNVDGSNLRKVTDLGGANWAPFYHPDNKRILFSSNHHTKRGFPFNLFIINEDGTGLEQVTFDTQFDSFPMFSPDGKKLIFGSNRVNGGTRATNLFIADWVN